jgi:uncharacterized protein (TIGR01732 family)
MGNAVTPVVGGFNNGFILLVVLFILLIIVGNSYPVAGGYGC